MSAPRELTVADVIERLREFPPYYHVSPLVNGTAGVSLAIWCQHMPDVGEPVVFIGEAPIGTPPTVPAEWTQGGVA